MQFNVLVKEAAERHNIPAALIKAIIQVESNGDPTAIGDNGASYGLMQVKLTTAREISKMPELTAEMLLKPGVNINQGTKYLAKQLKRYRGKYDKAVAAYNAGTVFRSETGAFVNQNYVNKVNREFKKITGRYLYAYTNTPTLKSTALPLAIFLVLVYSTSMFTSR